MRFIGFSDNVNSTGSTSNLVLVRHQLNIHEVNLRRRHRKNICKYFQNEEIESGTLEVELEHETPSTSSAATSKRRKSPPISAVESPLVMPAKGATTTRQIAERALSLMAPTDDCSAFGDYIAAELLQLARHDALTLKRRLTLVLIEFCD